MLARLALITAVLLPALAFAGPQPQDPSTTGGPIRIVAQPPRPAPARPAAQVSLRAAASAPGGDPSDCRMSCAQTYYFCRAGEDPDACAPTWGQCVAACVSPALAPEVAGSR
jgi:hypothetical protein